MTSSDVSTLIDSAVRSFREMDSKAAMRSVGCLADEPPEGLIEELGLRLFAASDQRGGAPLEPTPFMPDAAAANRLVHALRDEDLQSVRDAVDGSYPRLITTMICALAAMQ